MRNYLVTLTKGGRSYFVSASSAESAKQIVLDFEPEGPLRRAFSFARCALSEQLFWRRRARCRARVESPRRVVSNY
jgi:hypothetical protein